MKHPLRHPVLWAALPTLALAGCISFGAKPPPALLVLTPASAVTVGQAQSSAAARSIVVQVPTTPASLATARVPVQSSPTEIAYVKNAVWSEPPARLFARLLADTLTARAGFVVLSGVQSLSDPSATLGGDLRSFGIDATVQMAVVTYDATLIRPNQTAVEKRRFEARVPVAAVQGPIVGQALNDAANQVAAQVSDWARGTDRGS